MRLGRCSNVLQNATPVAAAASAHQMDTCDVKQARARPLNPVTVTLGRMVLTVEPGTV